MGVFFKAVGVLMDLVFKIHSFNEFNFFYEINQKQEF